MKEPDLQPLVNLHVGDIVSLIAVIQRAKPIASLVIPLEVRGWFERFCKLMHLITFDDGPSDSYQARIAVCCEEKTAKIKRKLDEIRALYDDIREVAIILHAEKARNEFAKALAMLQGAMFGYPECCTEFHAKKGESSRARAYEEFLESGMDQSIPTEFWAVAHAPCSSTCKATLELGRRYLDAVAEFSESLKNNVESRLLLPRFYQTGGGRFFDLKPLDYNQCAGELSVSKEQFEEEARSRLPEPVKTVLCDVPRPYVLVDSAEKPPYKTSFPNPEMIGTMWLAYAPGVGAYMVNAKTGGLALYMLADEWLPKVGEQWRSRSNFRIYRSVKSPSQGKEQGMRKQN